MVCDPMVFKKYEKAENGLSHQKKIYIYRERDRDIFFEIVASEFLRTLRKRDMEPKWNLVKLISFK